MLSQTDAKYFSKHSINKQKMGLGHQNSFASKLKPF
jgi:hypothetical protein